jgi:hypothetical protein
MIDARDCTVVVGTLLWYALGLFLVWLWRRFERR